VCSAPLTMVRDCREVVNAWRRPESWDASAAVRGASASGYYGNCFGATGAMQSDTMNGLTGIVAGSEIAESAGPARTSSLMGAGIAFEPRLTVRPTESGQVRDIVGWANRTGTPLVPVSSGGPHLHGGSLPSVPGAVQVDLSGMTRIPRIDRRQRLALIEPGVTFEQLIPALEVHGLRIAMPLLPRRNKSVLASMLEREPTLVPRWHWNMMEPLRSIEVVWGNGDVLITGSQTKTDKDEDWDTGIIPMLGGGPAQVDFFRMLSGAQGAMGIATWASVKVEPISENQTLLIIPAEKLQDLTDCAYRLLRFRFGDETFVANSVALSQLLARESGDQARLEAQMPRWCLVVGIGGGSILGASLRTTAFTSRASCRAARVRGFISSSRTPLRNRTGVAARPTPRRTSSSCLRSTEPRAS
jgi:FAD/FMN-containing dehydrogenase